MICFSNSFGSNTSFYDINNKKEQIQSFLETKVKDSSNERPRIRRKCEGLAPIKFLQFEDFLKVIQYYSKSRLYPC